MTETTGRQWQNGALHRFMVSSLPAFCSPGGDLHVRSLTAKLNRSHEAIYRWLRSNQLTPENARAIHDLANSVENARLLKLAGRSAPKMKDFEPFVYGV